MTTKTEPLASLAAATNDVGFATALTFDDVLLVPQHSTVLPYEVDVSTRLAEHSAERASAQCRHGYGD